MVSSGWPKRRETLTPPRGVQFTTFAYHRIRGAILDGLAEMDWFKRSHFYRGRYERLANEFLQLQSGEKRPDALQENARWLRDATSALAMVYLFCHQDSEDGGPTEVEDKATDTPQTEVIGRELKAKLHELIDELPPEAASLIRAAYFDGLTLKEAGERLGVSKSWASRLHSRTLDTLAKKLRTMELVD